VEALGDTCATMVSRILEHFAWFIEFMSAERHREALAAVTHESRYTVDMCNPFPAMKMNSKLLHGEMISLVSAFPSQAKQRLLGWFLL
jgi:hypothetical protein